MTERDRALGAVERLVRELRAMDLPFACVAVLRDPDGGHTAVWHSRLVGPVKVCAIVAKHLGDMHEEALRQTGGIEPDQAVWERQAHVDGDGGPSLRELANPGAGPLGGA